MCSSDLAIFVSDHIIAREIAAGAEALLRWNSEELGPVCPTEFIPVAEHSGLIIEIGRGPEPALEIVVEGAVEAIADHADGPLKSRS